MPDELTGRPAVVFGVGDLAQIVAVYLREESPYEVKAFTVHERYIGEPRMNGVPVVPFETLESSHPPGEYEMLVAVGFSRVNQARAEIYAECKARGYALLTYIHPSVRIWEETEIGDNCFISEGNVIQPFASVGDDTMLMTGCHIGHHSSVGSHCYFASHVAIPGHVKIGDHCFVGVNATFRNAITVGARNVIGAGAVVKADTEEGDVLSAAPAKTMSRKSWDLDGI